MSGHYETVPREEPLQGQLFHYSPQHVCGELGLNWLAAVRLYESGWLGFDPAKTGEMNEEQEMEFRFLGALVASGCDDRMLSVLLRPLQKPYLYSLNRIYFDWQCGGRWMPIPTAADFREEPSEQWIEHMKDDKDVETLQRICDLASEAIEEIGDEDPAP